MRTAIKEGKNPALLVKTKSDAPAKTFKDYALELIESKRAGWRNAKHAQQWENTLEQFTYEKIGTKLPADISLADVKSILLPMWATKTETAVRLRGRIESVLDYAIVHEDADRRNTARWKGNLDKVLPAPKKVTKVIHHPSANYIDVPDIMSRLRDKDTTSAYNLRFTILTAARSGESRGALWSEIDTVNKVWTIPAERMKAGREHKVPLCDEALEILEIMKKWNIKNSEIVFVGGYGKVMSDVAINKTLHAINPNVTVHGFRSSFRVWGAETTSTPSAVLELALAHVNPNEVEAAYQRSDLFERRRDLMTVWGNYCKTKGNVIQLVQSA
jgi:integrase